MNMSNEEMNRMHALYIRDKLVTLCNSDSQDNVLIILNTGINLSFTSWDDGTFSGCIRGLGVDHFMICDHRSVYIDGNDDTQIHVHFVGGGFIEFNSEDVETII